MRSDTGSRSDACITRIQHPKLRSWIGGPGTGKTSHLLADFREEVRSGVDLSDIRYTTFTRAQRADVVKRLLRDFPRQKTMLGKTIKTLHGAVLESLNRTEHAIRGNVGIIDATKSPGAFAAFCKREGLQYTPAKSLLDGETDISNSSETPLGNVLLAVSGYIRQNYGWTEADWGRAVNATGLYSIRQIRNPEAAIRRWWEHKRSEHLYEHDDYLHLALDVNAPAPAKVIFVDEFQDLSPVQIEIFRRWLEDPEVERLYIAGDPNQTVYDYRGADPRYLAEAHALAHGGHPPTDRPVSHRCPTNVVTMADTVLQMKSNMEPASEGGIARWLRARSDAEFARSIETLRKRYGKVMVLCRFTHHMRGISKLLQMEGVPHSSLTGRLPIWGHIPIDEAIAPKDKNGKTLKKTASMENLLVAMRTLYLYVDGKDMGVIPVDAARDLLYLLPLPATRRAHVLSEMKVRKMVNYHAEDLFRWFARRPSVLEIAEHLNIPKARRDTLTRALLRGGTIMPGNIVIDTIHASKGLQADVVLLHTGFSQKRRGECVVDVEKLSAERRIYYVGITRAQKAVYLFDGFGASASVPVVDVIRGTALGAWEGGETTPAATTP